MNWNDPEFLEAIRLIRKFYPESKVTVSEDKPLTIYDLISVGDWEVDASCEPFNTPPLPRLKLYELGGIEGGDHEILERLINYTGIKPTGRVVVVPDCVTSSREDRKPFVCHSNSLIKRTKEYDEDPDGLLIFDGASDVAVVFESGEAFVIDHDQRFFWSKAKSNKLKGRTNGST